MNELGPSSLSAKLRLLCNIVTNSDSEIVDENTRGLVGRLVDWSVGWLVDWLMVG